MICEPPTPEQVTAPTTNFKINRNTLKEIYAYSELQYCIDNMEGIVNPCEDYTDLSINREGLMFEFQRIEILHCKISYSNIILNEMWVGWLASFKNLR